MEAGTAANSDEGHKRRKYAALAESLSQLQSKRWECMVGPLESS